MMRLLVSFLFFLLGTLAGAVGLYTLSTGGFPLLGNLDVAFVLCGG